MIPLRFKIWALIVAAFALGLLGWRKASIDRALEQANAKRDRRRIESIKTAKEIREDVESQDDMHLVERAREWMRNDDK
jgi:hypothetical protein